MPNRKKILSGISIDFFGSIIATIVGFAVVPFYFDYITINEFGVWLAMGSLTALITIVDLGTDQYLTTVTANDEKFFSDSFKDYLTSILFIKSIISLLLGFIGILLYFFLANVIDIDKQYLGDAKIVLILGVLTLIAGVFFSTISTILYARHHYSLINSFISIFAILTSIGTLFVLSCGYGILSFPLVILGVTIIQHTILFIYMLKKYPHIKLRIRGFHFIEKYEIIGYTTTFQVLRWVHTLRTQYITLAINNLAGPMYVAQYNLTNKIPQMIPAYAVKIVHPFFPSIADYFQKGDIEQIQIIFIKINKILTRLAIFFSISILILNEAFLSLWVGHDKFTGNTTLLWITIYMFMYVTMQAFGIIIYASKKFENWTKWSLLEIIITLTTSYLFSIHFGLTGIIAGFVLSSMITQLYLFHIVLRQLNITKLSFFKEILQYALPSNILPLGTGIYVYMNISLSNWMNFIFVGILLVLSHLILDGLKVLTSNEPGIKNKFLKAIEL